MILKKSSSRSFQLPSRPDGKLELIRHEGAETKFQGISAKAKAKQLARSQLSSNELFDKLIESDVKEAKLEEVNNRRDLVSDNLDCSTGKGHFIKFTFNSIGLIDSVTYMGDEEIIL